MWTRFSLAAALLAVATTARDTAAQAPAKSATDWLAAHYGECFELYRWLHSHPELSFQEQETAAHLAKLWREAGYEVTTGVGGHGIVGLLKNGDGPVVMLRTDLDALPVTENTSLPFASTRTVERPDGGKTGVMHACGHDLHMTNLTAAAQYLAEHRDQWAGTLMLVGQPAEERGAGARAMLEDGLFERFPRPDYAVALHVDSTFAAGSVKLRPGHTMANVDSVDITVRGRGGHGSAPHTTVDPIAQAAELVLSLQMIVSREVKPIEPAVVTVGAIHGGTKHNIIGDTCHLQITVRSYSEAVRQQVLAAIRRRALAIAQANRAPEPEIEISEGTPALENDAELAGRLAEVFRRTLGDDRVMEGELSMGGEDFSQYGRAGVPILMYRLGSIDARQLARFEQLGVDPPSLHSAQYHPDFETTLRTGVATMTAAALDLLAPPAQ